MKKAMSILLTAVLLLCSGLLQNVPANADGDPAAETYPGEMTVGTTRVSRLPSI